MFKNMEEKNVRLRTCPIITIRFWGSLLYFCISIAGLLNEKNIPKKHYEHFKVGGSHFKVDAIVMTGAHFTCYLKMVIGLRAF